MSHSPVNLEYLAFLFFGGFERLILTLLYLVVKVFSDRWLQQFLGSDQGVFIDLVDLLGNVWSHRFWTVHWIVLGEVHMIGKIDIAVRFGSDPILHIPGDSICIG